MSVPRNSHKQKGALKFFTRLAFFFSMTAVLGVQPVHAAQYDIKTMTPEVQGALDGRKQRYDTLLSAKGSGSIGENNQGYVTVLNSSSGADSLAQPENADRSVIYNTIVEQNGLGGGGMEKVQIAFAEVQRERARGGDMIQLPNGDWVKK